VLNTLIGLAPHTAPFRVKPTIWSFCPSNWTYQFYDLLTPMRLRELETLECEPQLLTHSHPPLTIGCNNSNGLAICPLDKDYHLTSKYHRGIMIGLPPPVPVSRKYV
jgi:hypothetical protein